MKIENTSIKFTIPIPINKPDANGIIYTKEAISNALNNLQTDLPIIYEDIESGEKVIGKTTGTSCIVNYDFNNQICKLTVDGVIFNIDVEIVASKIQDGKITDFRISGFGLTK